MPASETALVDSVISSRRALLSSAGAAWAGLFLAGQGRLPAQTASTLTDNDYLNFALNLEYLEAQYYTLGSLGVTIDAATCLTNPITSGSGSAAGTVTVKSSPKVPCGDARTQAYATHSSADWRGYQQGWLALNSNV